MSIHISDPVPAGHLRRLCRLSCWRSSCWGRVMASLAWRFLEDTPVDYADIEDHFKYGSTGGERESGFPYWIWKAVPYSSRLRLTSDRLIGYCLPKNGVGASLLR